MKTQHFIKIGEVDVRLKITSNPNKIVLEMHSPKPLKYGEFMDMLESFILKVRGQKILISDYETAPEEH